MESLIILIIVVVFFLLGRFDGKRSFKKHTVSVTKPDYTPEATIWKHLSEKTEATIIFQRLAEISKGDGVVKYEFTFYTEEKA